MSYTQTEFTTFTNATMLQLTGTDHLAGNEEPTIPEWQGSISGSYAGQLSGDWGMYARVDLIYFGD